MKFIFLISIMGLTFFGCKTQQNNNNSVTDNSTTKIATEPFSAALPLIVIYKTTKDYSCNVPVTLSDDKKQIVSYPHPTDLLSNGKFAIPTRLHNGYWLDNRGIGKNVAFLKYTYKEYSELEIIPTLEILYNSILDKEPLVELWDCGSKTSFSDIQKQLNEWIDRNQLSEKCKQLK